MGNVYNFGMIKIYISAFIFLAFLMTTSRASAQEFSKTKFTFAQCAGALPLKMSKNPWLRIKKKTSGESFYVTPSVGEKTFSILNEEDPIYSAPTTLERIDCKNGFIYFRRSVNEPTITTFHRVYDLVTGHEYAVTEGAVAMAPNGRHLITISSVDRDQKCGRSSNCETNLKLYDCETRKMKKSVCKLVRSTLYSFTGVADRNVEFVALPLKWNWNKSKKTLKLDLGGFKKTQAKIQCAILPKYKCNVEVPKDYQVSIKN